MSNFDDIFAGQNNGSQWRDKPFNKEEWAAKKQGGKPLCPIHMKGGTQIVR